ncbi:MAG: RNA methyltransferase [Bdellovibrionales bacterium]|nr:RNA methyltransferase [Bdellovibrionales bacterium]
MKISSSSNGIFKELKALSTSKGLKEQGRTLVSGRKITHEVFRKYSSKDIFWVCGPNMEIPTPDLKNIELSAELFHEVDSLGTKAPLLSVPLPTKLAWTDLDSQTPALFCAATDPSNLGAIARSMVAFGVEQLVVLKEAAHPFLPRCLRASSGLIFDLRIFDGPSIHELDASNLFALDMHGKDIAKVEAPQNWKLLVGEEGQGIPKSFKGTRVSIPMTKKAESLNVAIATSIWLHRRYPV